MDKRENQMELTAPVIFQEKLRYRLVWNHARRLNKRGEGLVEIEIQQGTRRRYLSTHTYLLPENWSNGWVVGTPDDNARNYALRRMMWEVEQVELEFLKHGQRVTLPLLLDSVKSNVNPAAKLRDFGLMMIEDGKRKELTKSNYRTLLNDIDRFRPNTYLTDIDYQWVMAYDRWLKSRSVAHNTRVGRLRMLRAIMNEAYRRDLVYQEPFKRIRIDQMEAHRGFLTLKQLHTLENIKLDGKEDRVRDLFLVGCYTGLRFSDIRTLRQDHIEGDWIHKTTIKTGTEVWIPYRQVFLGKLQSILQKYGDIGRLTRQTPPNSETNRILRPLLDKLGCSNDITFHSSRHTFATILGQMGVPTGTIQRLLGHTTEKTTMIYNESHRDGRREILKSLKNKSKKTSNNEKNHNR